MTAPEAYIHPCAVDNIRVPEDVAVICYGYNSKENEEENRLTMIEFPIESLATRGVGANRIRFLTAPLQKQHVLCARLQYITAEAAQNHSHGMCNKSVTVRNIRAVT